MKYFLKFLTDAHIQGLGHDCTILNTLYLNNILFIENHNLTRDDKLLDIYINRKEKLLGFEDVDDFNSFYAQYDYNTNETHEVLSHFVVVALYSYYERTWKNMLIKTGVCTKEEYKKFYIYENFKKLFINKFGFDYDDWDDEDFRLLEEIRCLSNCIKHSGNVSEELSKVNPYWVVGEQIKDVPHKFIEEFVNVPFAYIKKVVEKIHNLNNKENNN
jgi:hypothetical protein